MSRSEQHGDDVAADTLAEASHRCAARFAEIELPVDGLPVVCRQAGDGPPLIHLPDAETPSPEPALTRLAERFRVIVIGPAAGESQP